MLVILTAYSQKNNASSDFDVPVEFFKAILMIIVSLIASSVIAGQSIAPDTDKYCECRVKTKADAIIE